MLIQSCEFQDLRTADGATPNCVRNSLLNEDALLNPAAMQTSPTAAPDRSSECARASRTSVR